MGSVRQADQTSQGQASGGGQRPTASSREQQQSQHVEEGGNVAHQSGNLMAEAMKRGGILGWGSYLTFAWAGPFLKLGSTVTLKEEHLEGIYDKHESHRN
ncbi:hypothetical protein Esi_0077_0043 [Ectocarpus siliculosus]|uniref:Uncharacterized protein n=1 Tax=Ectocarpus siliculosus TaxID=2880 RepID=D8LSW2_ECTSI|nr:hypothetical protein Esi_0077_0043 [Ectocarpus siliculosus]|eukprot:CBN77889.1 hypothetical protein Esi_0077_0043 [Ectocarpus siliculosus]